MNKNMYFLMLCISLLFVFLLGGCNDESQKIGKTEKLNILPAVKISSENKITSKVGISLNIAKDSVVNYIADMGVKGDIQSKLSIDEITIKEAWENMGIQLFEVRLDYSSIHGIVVVKDGQILSLLQGMPVSEAFLADIDEDGKYEIYANLAFGSGIVSHDISGYNIVTNTNYYVSRRAEKDFKLFVKDNILLVKVYPYGDFDGSTDTVADIKVLKIKKEKLLIEDPTYGYAVYKVKADSVKKALSYGVIEDGFYKANKNIDLSEIKLENTPIFSDLDIESYDWKTNTIVFNTQFIKENVSSQNYTKYISEKQKLKIDGLSLSFYGGSPLLNCTPTDAVVITVGAERIYSSGFILPAWSSQSPPEICIHDTDTNSISIRAFADFESMIKDKRIYDFFKKVGKLKE